MKNIKKAAALSWALVGIVQLLWQVLSLASMGQGSVLYMDWVGFGMSALCAVLQILWAFALLKERRDVLLFITGFLALYPFFSMSSRINGSYTQILYLLTVLAMIEDYLLLAYAFQYYVRGHLLGSMWYLLPAVSVFRIALTLGYWDFQLDGIMLIVRLAPYFIGPVSYILFGILLKEDSKKCMED